MNFLFKKIKDDKLNLVKNKYLVLLSFAILIILFQTLTYFITGGNLVFNSNDSFLYYLNEAKNIYEQKSMHDISKVLINIYLPYIDQTNIGFKDTPKPYHFPLYSIYISLFFYVTKNFFLIGVLSQMLLALGFLQFLFLILNNFYNKSVSFIFCTLFFLISPMFLLVADVSYELWTGCFILMIFYFGLFARNRDDLRYYLLMFVAINFSVLRVKYFILIPLMIWCYRLLPTKYNEEVKRISTKNAFLYLILLIILPILIQYYCYNILVWHKFSDLLYMHDGLKEYVFPIFSRMAYNLIYIFSDGFYFYHNRFLVFINLIGLIFFIIHLWDIVKKQKLKRFDVIIIFNYILFCSITVLYVPDGFRMLLSCAPFVLIMIYRNHHIFKKIFYFNYKKPFIILIIIVFGNFLIKNITWISFRNEDFLIYNEQNIKINKILNEYNINKSATNFWLFKNYLVPMMHIYDNKYFLIYDSIKNYCADYEKNPDNVELMPIIFSNELNDLVKEEKCLSILEKYEKFKKYDIEFYLKKDIIISKK